LKVIKEGVWQKKNDCANGKKKRLLIILKHSKILLNRLDSLAKNVAELRIKKSGYINLFH
jgi:hypothetical protein